MALIPLPSSWPPGPTFECLLGAYLRPEQPSCSSPPTQSSHMLQTYLLHPPPLRHSPPYLVVARLAGSPPSHTYCLFSPENTLSPVGNSAFSLPTKLHENRTLFSATLRVPSGL